MFLDERHTLPFPLPLISFYPSRDVGFPSYLVSLLSPAYTCLNEIII